MTLRTSDTAQTLAVVAILLTACTDAPAPSFEEVRAATSRYQSVDAALADGYTRDPLDVCETAYYLGELQDLGAIGVHYLRRDLLGVEAEMATRLDVTGIHDDFLRPALLVYEPQADSTLQLVAIANMVNARAWEEVGHRNPPSFGKVPFISSPDDQVTGYPAHYHLHMWLYRDNPSGMFAPYNPAVTCANHVFNLPAITPDSIHSAPHH
ncbi:MAG: hypothetical protein EXR91_05275 [Gemmatimonadetes bacterium]|nr:hypothetical protein [Gemmatimonadota bacterium]